MPRRVCRPIHTCDGHRLSNIIVNYIYGNESKSKEAGRRAGCIPKVWTIPHDGGVEYILITSNVGDDEYKYDAVASTWTKVMNIDRFAGPVKNTASIDMINKVDCNSIKA